ncbi:MULTISPECIES: ABC transporter ATP-binding protein [Bacillaceae]|uniref:ABC transporter ATP-binding protein n=1 Tax=Evansella alkalicola TaxID=745819 RepID=A0ABS6JYN9_9BACI|nr:MULTISPECIES: ABC transporter ATP-binding protein [Bacillaceae]MBU9723714.1 ABC transporter ATP-binding protein [Bacillus alkalicola]
MTEVRITLRGIRKKYSTQQALTNIDLTLERKGIVGLIGPNGSGKSTFLKLIAGLLQPSSGEILLSGKKVSRRSASHIAFLAEIDSLYGFQTVGEAIRFWKETTPDFSEEKALEMASALGVDLQKKIKHLSKGNRARVKLLLTLSREVPILLMDEPLSGLDPLVRQDILRMIVSYVDVEKQMVILSTHEVSEVEPFLDYVIFLKDGEIVLEEGTDSLREKNGKSLVETMKEVLV